MQRQGDCPHLGLWGSLPWCSQARVLGVLIPLLLGPPSGEKGISWEMLGVHAVDQILFIDHSRIRMIHDLSSLSNLGRGTATVHQMHLCSKHVIPPSSLGCMAGQQLPQAPPSPCAQMWKLRPGRD